jgi:hypothetical protein
MTVPKSVSYFNIGYLWDIYKQIRDRAGAEVRDFGDVSVLDSHLGIDGKSGRAHFLRTALDFERMWVGHYIMSSDYIERLLLAIFRRMIVLQNLNVTQTASIRHVKNKDQETQQ